MRIAITVWEDRVSPVLDSSQTMLVLDYRDGIFSHRGRESFFSDSLFERVSTLARLNVDVLICGALTQDTSNMIMAKGIHIYPFVSGGTNEVLEAFKDGNLDSPMWRMPGFAVSAAVKPKKKRR